MIGLTTTVDQRRFGKWLFVLAHALRAHLTSRDAVHDDLYSVLTPLEFSALVRRVSLRCVLLYV